MTRRLLFLRGLPGSGKITVGRILAKELGWRLLWLHDFDPVFRAVGDWDPRLVDRVTLPVLKVMLERWNDVIYVRPAGDERTVESVRVTAEAAGARMLLVRLQAERDTLTYRLSCRRMTPENACRIKDEAGLDEYLAGRPAFAKMLPGECVVPTDVMTPEETARTIRELLCL